MRDLDDKALDQEKHVVTIDAKDADIGAALVTGESALVDAAEGLRIRRKIDKHILPLMCILYLCVMNSTSLVEGYETNDLDASIQAVDKNTLGYSAILGMRTSAHLTVNQYNWLGTIFFLSYFAFEYPQNLALQRFPVGKWMTLNILVWGVVLICHAACTSFAGLFVVRLILGMCEGSVTAGFMITNSMFWTRDEQIVRIGLWYGMTGLAQIVGGFLSFGSLHIHTGAFEPWQWLMAITGILTILTAVAFYCYYPDSPANAWFLNEEERIAAIQRVKGNQTGVENKHFKKQQLIETLTDPKTWLFGFYALLCGASTGGLAFQRQIIVSSFGFSNLQTTLLGCVDGVIQIVAIYIGVELASRIPNSRGWLAMAFYIPNILGALLVNLLPWGNRVGLLFAVWLTDINATTFVLVLIWVGQTTAGHTKKVTTNAIVFGGDCLGAAVAQFLWQAKYSPRNHIPWIVTGVMYVLALGTLLANRTLLDLRNKHRATVPHNDAYEDVHVVRLGEDGKHVEVKVAKEFLDLTDKQNSDFRYAL
ncbi:MFS general substrate transporter [Artomyces pyxidatus]|uniref:MFS general substrate transporter n=1 Tax=Artomyces pyxidatus TaxID=48021 RepID=A0ACB8TAZ4_9AGAM|nr:MFS general substrate transporter [Artomyces pyxidatus]